MLKIAETSGRLERSQGTLQALSAGETKRSDLELARMSKAMIADHQPLFRDALRDIILRIHDFDHIFEASNLKGATETVSKHGNVGLFFFDLDMPEMQGLGGLSSLNETAPSLPIIVMSARVNRYVASQAIGRGAMGFIAKSASRDEIVDAIQQVLVGNICICAGSGVLERGGSDAGGHPGLESEVDLDQLQPLTRRQLIVLERMTLGESNKQIAHKLHLAETTVKAHVSAVLRKLNVKNRGQAIIAASCLEMVPQIRKE